MGTVGAVSNACREMIECWGSQGDARIAVQGVGPLTAVALLLALAALAGRAGDKAPASGYSGTWRIGLPRQLSGAHFLAT